MRMSPYPLCHMSSKRAFNVRRARGGSIHAVHQSTRPGESLSPAANFPIPEVTPGLSRADTPDERACWRHVRFTACRDPQ
jgi:hypothetical protein